MIELKAITIEKDGHYEGNNINIELWAPYNFDAHEFQRQFREYEFSFTAPRANIYDIHKIYHNAEKGTTVVCFKYSVYEIFGVEEPKAAKIKVKRDAEDQDDIYMAVASAVMIRKYKSNSQFKAHIRRSIPKGFDGRSYVYQLMAAAEVSDIYGSWEKFCKIVDEKLEVYHGKRKKTDAR